MRKSRQTVLCGDALVMLSSLETESAQVASTSPPYYRLRDYGHDGQMGLEGSPEEYLHSLWAVFDEVYRVLRLDGTIWVNIGDCYAGSGKGPTGHNGIGNQVQRQGFDNDQRNAMRRGMVGDDVPAKSLMMIPERFAWGMIQRGWILRKKIAWCKRSAMPESVTDRPTSAWEVIYLFSKSSRYYYDAEAVRQIAKNPTQAYRFRNGAAYVNQKGAQNNSKLNGGRPDETEASQSANLRDYWLLGPEPTKAKHYAAYPREIPRRCIKAGSSERGQCPECGSPWHRIVDISYTPHGVSAKAQVKTTSGERGSGDLQLGGIRPQELPFGRATKNVDTIGWQPSCQCNAGDPVPQTVLDPFLGTGTTLVVADELGRDGIGIEIVPGYAEISEKRLRGIHRLSGVPKDRTKPASPGRPSMLEILDSLEGDGVEWIEGG